MFLACDQGLSRIVCDFGQVPYGIDEETSEHGVPLSGMRFALVRVFSPIYLLKVAWAQSCSKERRKQKKGERVPATKENSVPGGKLDGRTSGIFTGRSSASLQGIFENE